MREYDKSLALKIKKAFTNKKESRIPEKVIIKLYDGKHENHAKMRFQSHFINIFEIIAINLSYRSLKA